jgi:hypothetical protein
MLFQFQPLTSVEDLELVAGIGEEEGGDVAGALADGLTLLPRRRSFCAGDEWASGKGLVHGSTREEFPQGLRKKSERKANLAKDGSAGAKQAAKKDLFLAEMPENRTSGDKWVG